MADNDLMKGDFECDKYSYKAAIKVMLKNILSSVLPLNNSINSLNTTSSNASNTLISINNKLTSRTITPNMLNVPISTSGTISASVYSISFCNTSTSEDALVLGEVLKPLTTVSFDSGVLNNKYPANVFTYDSQNAELLITYNS